MKLLPMATIVMALSLLGCGSEVLPWDRAPLLTSSSEQLDSDGNVVIGCVLMGVMARLVVDPNTGTALEGVGERYPIRWPKGFSGRRAGSELEVLDTKGEVVATTGRSYEIFYTEVGFTLKPGVEIRACGEVRAL